MKNLISLVNGLLLKDCRRLTLAAGLLTVALASAWGCTSALVGAQRGAGGRWLLWKHRDSGHPDNYVRCFEATDSTMAYVALFNAATLTAGRHGSASTRRDSR